MTHSRKFWLWLTGAAALAIVLSALVLPPPLPHRGTASPPLGLHKAGDVWLADLGGKTTMAMAWCPPGKFMMGSPVTETGRDEDEEQHEVTIPYGFWLGKYEITQQQWESVMNRNSSHFPQRTVINWHVLNYEIPIWRKNLFNKGHSFPVEMVSWNDCQEFCKKLGTGWQLPRETEWEYACRAGSISPIAGIGVLDKMGWYTGNSNNSTHPVGCKRPNAWGLYDMHGNVWEWCQDPFLLYPSDSLCNNIEVNRVSRGGSLASPINSCRSAYRRRGEPNDLEDGRGFRVMFLMEPEIKIGS